MDLEARDIHNKQFHDAWRGYNQEEVDDFLDRVAEVLDRVQRENRALQQRIRDLEEHVARGRDAEEMLKRTLVGAQRAAEDAIGTAKSKAEKLIAEAEERARKHSTDASKRADQLEREHAARKRELDETIVRLKAHESDLRKKLRGFLQEQLRLVERLDSLPGPAEPQRQQTPPPQQRPAPEQAAPSPTRATPLRATPSSRAPDDDALPLDAEDPEGRGRIRSFTWRQGKQ